MSRRKGRNVHGIVLLDKPAGLSSNQAVQRVRRLFDARKAGHTGSLDPFATGLLPICLGEATKTAAFMLEADKAYRATALLGVATATGDTEGEVTRESSVPSLAEPEIRDVLARFEGTISQIPPMYSALKHKGKPLYRLAREGVEVHREARNVEIHELRLCHWTPLELEFEVRCSKGTYIRTLAEDLAAAMGSCAHLVALRRLSVGLFLGQDMHSLEMLEALQAEGKLERSLLAVDAGLADWPQVKLTADAARRFSHGNPVDAVAEGLVRVYGPQGILGLGEGDPAVGLRPKRVFNLD